jgi:hypothetical protein
MNLHIDNLPNEVLALALSWITERHLIKRRLVSHRFNEVIIDLLDRAPPLVTREQLTAGWRAGQRYSVRRAVLGVAVSRYDLAYLEGFLSRPGQFGGLSPDHETTPDMMSRYVTGQAEAGIYKQRVQFYNINSKIDFIDHYPAAVLVGAARSRSCNIIAKVVRKSNFNFAELAGHMSMGGFTIRDMAEVFINSNVSAASVRRLIEVYLSGQSPDAVNTQMAILEEVVTTELFNMAGRQWEGYECDWFRQYLFLQQSSIPQLVLHQAARVAVIKQDFAMFCEVFERCVVECEESFIASCQNKKQARKYLKKFNRQKRAEEELLDEFSSDFDSDDNPFSYSSTRSRYGDQSMPTDEDFIGFGDHP